MIHIRSPADLQRRRLPQNLHQAVSRILTGIIATIGPSYNPDNDGYIIVITATDTDSCLSKRLGRPWRDSLFEGVSYSRDTKTWHVVYLHNNQYTMSLVVEDSDRLDQAIRRRFMQDVVG